MPRFMLWRTVKNVVAALTTTVSRMTTFWAVPMEEKTGGKIDVSSPVRHGDDAEICACWALCTTAGVRP